MTVSISSVILLTLWTLSVYSLLCLILSSGEDAEVFDTNWTQHVESFDEMGLKKELLRGIYAFGF